MKRSDQTIRLNLARVIIWLRGIAVLILFLSLLGQRQYNVGNPTEKFFLEMFTTEFYINNGANIATYWTMLMLIIMALLAFAIAVLKLAHKDRNRYNWSILGAVFLFFAADELSGSSEKFGTLLKDLPDMQVGTYYNWLYPAAAAAVVIVLVFLVRFYFQLDADNRILFPISMTLYVLGAFRAELFSGYYAELFGKKNLTYLWMTHAEELAEYAGIIIMIHLLLTYIAARYPEIEFIAEQPERTT